MLTMKRAHSIFVAGFLSGIIWIGSGRPACGDIYDKVWDSGSAIPNIVLEVAVGDMDGDGKPEIIASDHPTSGVKIYVFEATGDNSYQLVWDSGTTLTRAYCRIEVGDQDGDGKFEIIAGEFDDPAYNGRLHIFENHGDDAYQEVWDSGSALNGANITALFLGDADDDGKGEIIVGTGPLGNSKIRVYENTGDNAYQEVWTSDDTPTPVSDTVLEGVVGDADRDGKKEIILGSGDLDSQVHVFENTGDDSYQLVWDSGGTFDWQMWVTTGDQDNDGNFEIIAGGEERAVHVFEHTGADDTYAEVWNSGDMNAIVGSFVATGDQDRDGNREIIAPCSDGKVYVFENTGDNSYQEVWNSGSIMSGYIYEVATGDQDGDGRFEIIAATGPENKIYVFESPISLIFKDGFESGDTSAWSGTVPVR